ncbi:uncharacterized protein BXZ73DRAFT_48132 [Epithele typhae]|uniref:uncharacterized protein n=1 Tax=Epithele typhae TaxID=378194 RepID=UPI002007A7EA|nr:uncharacterized protein BXZ73DRAFT_48132 [Epithele typhae]KAH9929515.1 hypothetical protein BXZ73DRAFT_48132 [Epithele typhae]
MSSESSTTASKKRAAASEKRTSGEDDHRRKRRNRPTQSCLNCHTSKRMCDRQRPCGRCTQLGLTGLCVYEVDNPSHRANAQDEAERLKKRVAELESIIRELKNKPHPRWAHSGQGPASSEAGSPPHDSDVKAGPSTSGSSSPSSPKSPRAQRRGTSSPSTQYLEPRALSSAVPSPLLTPSPGPHSPVEVYMPPGGDPMPSLLTPEYDFSSLLASYHATGGGPPMDDGFFGDMLHPLLSSTAESCSVHSDGEHCGCLHDHASYNTVLELSLRLRRATDILSGYAKHGARSECKIHKSITDLDRFTTSALGNIVTPPEVGGPHAQSRTGSAAFPRAPFAGSRPAVAIPAAQMASQSIQSPRAWDFKQGRGGSYPSPPWDDSFMSWEPLRH